ncbi:MAG: RNB domain-containing ribonuclease, partial [Muribaculaceae bacterium]|nr:RNB domain-containing ribonuclease [Muribaculaceae bacterium]
AVSIGKVSGGKKQKSFVYRVHDNPDPEKITNFSQIARRFGYKVKTEGSAKVVNQSVNKLLKNVKGKGEENMLAMLAIRSMAKAIYTTDNVGHYGLALDYYTHFTSPIRRYPDMMVHRLLAKYADGARSVDKMKLEDQCKHSSDMEQLAANAERASIRYKQVEYMQDRLGEVYDGVISGVTEWGFYVELNDNKCEGLVPVRDLADDYYDYDEKNFCLIGRKHHNKYTLGDEVKVQVARADLDRKQLDFALITDEGNPNKPLPEQKRKNPRHDPKGKGKMKQRSRGGNHRHGKPSDDRK